uniref:Uncharacterized protein n=1 Tax=Vombatus ursinus TaxID=29139 RepID=A0A4X2KCC8_VOMUR
MTVSTKSSNQNFIIFLNEVQAAIIGNKGSDFFFAILNQLDSHTLPDGRIGLLGFYTNFFQDNPFCVRCSSKWVGLQGSAQMSFLILFAMPLLVSPVALELSSSMKTMALFHAATVWPERKERRHKHILYFSLQITLYNCYLLYSPSLDAVRTK